MKVTYISKQYSSAPLFDHLKKNGLVVKGKMELCVSLVDKLFGVVESVCLITNDPEADVIAYRLRFEERVPVVVLIRPVVQEITVLNKHGELQLQPDFELEYLEGLNLYRLQKLLLPANTLSAVRIRWNLKTLDTQFAKLLSALGGIKFKVVILTGHLSAPTMPECIKANEALRFDWYSDRQVRLELV